MHATAQKPGFEKVIVVGAGPAGLLLALLLANRGINVQVLEATDGKDGGPRASHYASAAVHELERAGVLEQVQTVGFICDKTCWRKMDGTYLTGFQGRDLEGYPDRLTCLPIDKLAILLTENLKLQKTASVEYQHKVVSIGQDERKAWVVAETPEGSKTFEADYIVGCDGGRSQIRRCLFGSNFPGRTWDRQIVATNTYFDFSKLGYEDGNFIIHPDHFYLAARLNREGLWRFTYGEKAGLTHEEMLARQPQIYEKIIPGNPKPHEHKLVAISPYRMHQRIVEKMRVGRFLLAADAAHLCSPFGGLGLTGGIVDVGGLSDCLAGIWEGKADESILDKYSEIRRKMYLEFIDPISTENTNRLFGQNADTALEDDQFLKILKKAETDLELSRKVQYGVDAIKYDFTKHYNDTKAV